VIVEDTFTTGGSSLEAVARVREEWKAEIAGVFGLVDREAGAAAAFAARGIPFHALLRLSELRGASSGA
jgi:orotate phosphoribosyltransferase